MPRRIRIAVILRAGMDGIKNKIMPPENIDENIQKMTQEQRDALHIEELPRSLKAAVAELEKDELIRDVLGEKLANKIIAAHRKEYRDYYMQVTDWEIANYLYKV